MISIKALVKQAIGSKLMGAMDYYRFPKYRKSWGGPLNGQQRRQEVVALLFKELEIKAVVETGTYRGTTSEYFDSLCSGPIFTIEASDRLYGYAKMRLLFHRKVKILHADSRVALKNLISEPKLAGKHIFFYLDAHWDQDLPLAEEIELVFANWKQAIVMIDDFQVPDDAGYSYDDYGEGKVLTLDYTKPVVEKYGLKIFFPSVPSTQETGARRGSVLFALDPLLTKKLSNIRGLRPY